MLPPRLKRRGTPPPGRCRRPGAARGGRPPRARTSRSRSAGDGAAPSRGCGVGDARVPSHAPVPAGPAGGRSSPRAEEVARGGAAGVPVRAATPLHTAPSPSAPRATTAPRRGGRRRVRAATARMPRHRPLPLRGDPGLEPPPVRHLAPQRPPSRRSRVRRGRGTGNPGARTELGTGPLRGPPGAGGAKHARGGHGTAGRQLRGFTSMTLPSTSAVRNPPPYSSLRWSRSTGCWSWKTEAGSTMT